MKSLSGKLVYLTDPTGWKTGKILDQLTPEYYLVQVDLTKAMREIVKSLHNPPVLVHLHEMAETYRCPDPDCDDEHKIWRFFENERERQQVIDHEHRHIDEQETPRIPALVN